MSHGFQCSRIALLFVLPLHGNHHQFLFRNNASAGVSKPAPHKMPAADHALIKASLFTGRMCTFFSAVFFLLCLLNTCQLIFFTALNTLMIRASSYAGKYTVKCPSFNGFASLTRLRMTGVKYLYHMHQNENHKQP